MGEGGWRREDGGWRMEDGGGRMEDGGWRVEDGGWRMEDGGWRMEDGGWRMEDGVGEPSPRPSPRGRGGTMKTRRQGDKEKGRQGATEDRGWRARSIRSGGLLGTRGR